MKKLYVILAILTPCSLAAQTSRWQQKVDYTMHINFDVKTHSFSGTQKLIYTNNSPDTLQKLYYHLYLNAFQPGSMMDVRSRNIEDPDSRVGDRIATLTDSETGKLYPTSLTMDGQDASFTVSGTILQVVLPKPLLPGTSATLNMHFQGQVPVQIRRTGRNNSESIEYSMAQWYPKLSEYDYAGWHANPYVAREFHGVWGNFDVHITLNSQYVVAATGVLQNPEEIGYGYLPNGQTVKHKKNKNLTWHFKAENVHDFVWAADPDYVHQQVQIPLGPLMHFFYQPDSITRQTWPQLIETAPKMVSFMNQRFGQYPYSDYSVIQGGDGGMEYPMATLILGRGSFTGLLSVTVHEMFHSWYQGVLASNESLYPWMDEGFTTYAANITKSYLAGNKADPQASSYAGYRYLVNKNKQEPLTTHADHYHTNLAYGIAAYSMGSMVPAMLAYIVGEPEFEKAFRAYFNAWKFKHPNPTDFRRIIEKETGFELAWFFNDWIGTTHHVDYGIEKVVTKDTTTQVTLSNKGTMPMPIEVYVTYTDGTSEIFYYPLRMMRKDKTSFNGIKATKVSDWPWTNPTMVLQINKPKTEIKSIHLNHTHRLPDINPDNNFWENK